MLVGSSLIIFCKSMFWLLIMVMEALYNLLKANDMNFIEVISLGSGNE